MNIVEGLIGEKLFDYDTLFSEEENRREGVAEHQWWLNHDPEYDSDNILKVYAARIDAYQKSEAFHGAGKAYGEISFMICTTIADKDTHVGTSKLGEDTKFDRYDAEGNPNKGVDYDDYMNGIINEFKDWRFNRDGLSVFNTEVVSAETIFDEEDTADNRYTRYVEFKSSYTGNPFIVYNEDNAN